MVEDSVVQEKADLAKEDKANSTCHMNTTRIVGKKVRVLVETSEEGWEFMPKKVNKTNPSSEITVEI